MSIINIFKNNRRKSLSAFLSIFTLAILIFVQSGTFAQISDFVLQDGTSVESPSGLKQKPSDIGTHASETRSNLTEMRSSAGSENENLPDHVIYGQIFHHIKELNKKADQEELAGRDGSHLRKLYQNMSGLTNQESAVLDQIAGEVNEEISVLDTKARIIITNLRAQTPDGKLGEGETPPTPPAELFDLSNKRQEVILKAKTNLENKLGTNSFAKFQSFVDDKVKPGIRSIN